MTAQSLRWIGAEQLHLVLLSNMQLHMKLLESCMQRETAVERPGL